MSGKLLVINGRLQRAQGFLLRGQAPENAAVPCPCCGKTYYVELRPCCTPANVGDVDSPYPPGGAGSRWFITLGDLEASCGAREFGYLSFYPDGTGVGQFCMQFNRSVRPPIPASALPEEAVILDTAAGVTCTSNINCLDETVCPPCPSCCQERDWSYRCMRLIDPHPSNPTNFTCNYGREYLTTYTTSTVTYRKRWQTCTAGGSGRCEPFDQEDTSVVTVGNMSFRKACAPDFVASCTGQATTTQTTRTELFGSFPPSCTTGPLTGGSVTENTDVTTSPCANFSGTPTFPPPDIFYSGSFEDEPCSGERVIDYRCDGATGDLQTRERWTWNFDRACFDGSNFFEYTRQSWYMDASSCTFAECLAGPPIPCTGDLCSDERTTIEATWAIQILSVDECGGPWETAKDNFDNGYPIDGGGFFDGWAITGVGDAAEFL